MPARKRGSAAVANPDVDKLDGSSEPIAKRRSSRHASASVKPTPPATVTSPAEKTPKTKQAKQVSSKTAKGTPKGVKDTPKSTPKETKSTKSTKSTKDKPEATDDAVSRRGASPDPDPATIPRRNPEAVRHDGKWYWLLKAEPESRFENGIDVRFSIDDLRACTKPEGWDGIRSYAARNNLRAMNEGDMAFFYHSNCKTPGIVGTMEIAREYSEDKSARRPGTPYYDPQSTKDKPRWSLVHVEFRRKFAVPIYLPELRELGKPGGPLEEMQMLRQSRVSVSKVSGGEWEALCKLADEKAKEAGLKHEDK